MLETYFVAPKTLNRLRTGPSAPYIDGFADMLEQNGYAPASAIRYLRAAAHLGHFMQRQGATLADSNTTTPEAFRHHLPTCRCPLSNGGRINHHPYFGVKRFYEYLCQIGVCQSETISNVKDAEPALVTAFRRWFQTHRGVTEPTLKQYCRGATEILNALGDDPSQWDAQQVRDFFLVRAKLCGAGTAEKLVTALRAFLRYLSAHGLCRADLDDAVPAWARWRLTTLPRYLAAEEVRQLLVACEGSSLSRLRDRAMILLLVRLGLRAGDVAGLHMADIEWESGTLRVTGKGRYEVRLPLSQEVGDALLRYLESRAPLEPNDHLFVPVIAPWRPSLSAHGVSGAVKRALQRAAIVAPIKGAHLLRHTAASEMLRQGVALDQIGSVLRHRGIDTTAYYAKVDQRLLRQIVQPWPEVLQ
jgi:site-specific recombinase XerD